MDLYRSKHSDKKYPNRNSSSNDRPSRSFRNSNDDRGSRYSRDDRGSRYSRDDRDNDRESTTVTCADCSVECTVPFVPRSNKPVYCSDCFRKYKPDDSSNDRPSRDDRGSRYSRDDRGSRYSRDDRGSRYSRDNSRSSRGKSDKLLRKQESFYSNGSAKFNESLQKKLYEILGGKTCSSCGSNDERALGICDINGNQISGDTRRGSAASSWGKYISAPDIAKKELKVFCSNCNDAVVPAKPQEDRSRSKSKKSKYFPR
jgi:CxxC-x17-CxxC domain-containing protein